MEFPDRSEQLFYNIYALICTDLVCFTIISSNRNKNKGFKSTVNIQCWHITVLIPCKPNFQKYLTFRLTSQMNLDYSSVLQSDSKAAGENLAPVTILGRKPVSRSGPSVPPWHTDQQHHLLAWGGERSVQSGTTRATDVSSFC